MVFLADAGILRGGGRSKWRRIGFEKMKLNPSTKLKDKAKENPLGDEHFMEKYEVYPDGVNRKLKVVDEGKKGSLSQPPSKKVKKAKVMKKEVKKERKTKTPVPPAMPTKKKEKKKKDTLLNA